MSYRYLAKGPLDSTYEIDGASLETLVLQELLATNEYYDLGYHIYYWQTKNKVEVDFILYGEKGLIAIEVKRSNRLRNEDLKGLKLFIEDYPIATPYLLYSGTETLKYDGVDIVPIDYFLKNIKKFI